MNRIQSSTASVLLVAAALGGCASPLSQPARDDAGVTSVVYNPKLNEINRAELGKTILSKEFLTRTPGIVLGRQVSERVNPPGTTNIMAGELALHRSDSTGEYFSGNATYSVLGQSVPSGERAGIFVPKDSSKPALIYHFANSYFYGKSPVIDYSKITITTFSRDSFRRELIYTGMSQNTITLQYREFNDNLARPAFTQELKYDLSQGKEIGYNGARFEIINAGNVELTYKVIKPLD